MTGLFFETLEHARVVARLVGHIVYLKHLGGGWMLSDKEFRKPYYSVYPNGDAVEIPC
jgi:hypothetical protein